MFAALKQKKARQETGLLGGAAKNCRQLATKGAGLAARERQGAYFNRANTLWGCWFACANIAVAACWMI